MPITIGTHFNSERPFGVRAKKAEGSGGLPQYRWVSEDEATFEPGILATWSPRDPECPSGVVLLNLDHPLLLNELTIFKDDYGVVHATEIEKIGNCFP